jgi:guanyl-specific ribonuclease Sa
MMGGTVRRTAWILVGLAIVATAAAVVWHQTRDRVAVEPVGSAPARPRTGEEAGSAPPTVARPAPPVATHAGRAAPAALGRAREVLAAIEERDGAPLPGYVGGREFHNRERRLPPGQYREYDVRPRVAGRDRGPERLVIDRTTGRAYYTGDHYRTFVPLN